MASTPPSRSAMEIELSKLSSPRIFLVRMLVFLVLCALVMVVLYKQIVLAFFANPGLNALIGAVLAIVTVGLVNALVWYGRLHYRLLKPALEPHVSGGLQ